MINGDPLWHVSAIKLWANWSSFNKINGSQYTVSSIINAYEKSLNYPFDPEYIDIVYICLHANYLNKILFKPS